MEYNDINGLKNLLIGDINQKIDNISLKSHIERLEKENEENKAKKFKI